jgi:hypothetical protein
MSQNYGDANNIINVSALILFQPAGITDRWMDFGNINQVVGSLGVTKKQAYFSVNGIQQLAKDVVTLVKPEFTLQCNEFPAPLLYKLYGGTLRTALTQALVATATVTIANAAPYDVAVIPGYNPTVISVKMSTTSLVAGVDYDLVGGGVKASAIRFRSGSTFIDGTQSIVVTYSLPAITTTAFPKIWSMDMFNNLNTSGTIQITFTDQYSNLFNHRLSGNCFLSPSKVPDYKPDDFATCEFIASFAGPGILTKVEI